MDPLNVRPIVHTHYSVPEIQEDFILCLASCANAGIEKSNFCNLYAFLKEIEIYGCTSLSVEEKLFCFRSIVYLVLSYLVVICLAPLQVALQVVQGLAKTRSIHSAYAEGTAEKTVHKWI